MGRKSRAKRERKLASRYDFLLQDIPVLPGIGDNKVGQKTYFSKHLDATLALFRQYKSFDLAVALLTSELWPANTGSSIKHIFAWRVFLALPCEQKEGQSIDSYDDFIAFTDKLYAAWPEFPMLEDCSPEADWGQTRVRLGVTPFP